MAKKPDHSKRAILRTWMRWQGMRRNPQYRKDSQDFINWLKSNDSAVYEWVMFLNQPRLTKHPDLSDPRVREKDLRATKYVEERPPGFGMATQRLSDSFKTQWSITLPLLPTFEWKDENNDDEFPSILDHIDSEEYHHNLAVRCEEYDSYQKSVWQVINDKKSIEEKAEAIRLKREGKYQELLPNLRERVPSTLTLEIGLHVRKGDLMTLIGEIIEKSQSIMKSYGLEVTDQRVRIDEAKAAFLIWDLRKKERLTYQEIIDQHYPGESI